nr:twin-arginine translocase TatA/TatE family subunit [Microbacterium testaceum]
MLQNLTGWHALLVLAVVILVFGAAKLPALARSLGQSVRILRSEAGDSRAEDATALVDDTRRSVPTGESSTATATVSPATAPAEPG